jgi:uncharacterized protein YhhL (DUF1145 family)
MADALASDVAVTWIAALACVPYLRFLWRAEAPAGGRAALALVALLGLLLALRGFDWLDLAPWLGGLTFAVATWLPLATTIFCERLLRRHHPLWLKVLALGVSVGFFVFNLVAPLAQQQTWTIAFAGAFAVVMACNALLLLRANDADLGVERRRLARVLVLVALIAAPLLVSDFRTLLGWPPVRLGSLAAMLFIHVMLAAEARLSLLRELVGRLFAWTVQGLALAGVFAWVMGFQEEDLWRHALAAWPVAIALLMLAAIVVSSRALSVASAEGQFLRWLRAAPLADLDRLLDALGDYLPMRQHVRLQGSDLKDYDLAVLWRLADAPVSLARARAAAASSDPAIAEAGEQWCDLLERHDMNHALALRAEPALVVLVELAASSTGSIAHLRAAVVQQIGRSLADRR